MMCGLKVGLAMPTEAALQVESRLWYLYMVRCNKGQLYTGISTDVARRFAAHKAGKGAKFLRGKGPLALQLELCIGSHSEALQVEARVKKLSKAAKEHLLVRHGDGRVELSEL